MTVTRGAGYLHPAWVAGYVEAQGGAHADLTDGLRNDTRDLPPADQDELFATV